MTSISQFRYIFKMKKFSFTNARNVAVKVLSNSTPRFLTDDEESREQPSSVRQCSRLLLVWFLGLIINTSVISEFSSMKLFVIQFFISTMHSISFSIWCVSPGREEI